MSEIERRSLEGLEKAELINLVFKLKGDITKMHEDFMKITNLRLYHLERNQNMNTQYGRRESFEIVGIPADIPDDKLEDEVLEITKEAKVNVNRQPLKKTDVCAVHRLKNKQTTIVRVVNRKFSTEAIFSGKNLKGTKRYGEGNIFINPSFCPEFRFLNWVIRRAKKDGRIHRYKIRNGITYVQLTENDDFTQIGHELDLKNLGIDVPERRKNAST